MLRHFFIAQAYNSGTQTTDPTKSTELRVTRAWSALETAAVPGESTRMRHPGGWSGGYTDGRFSLVILGRSVARALMVLPFSSVFFTRMQIVLASSYSLARSGILSAGVCIMLYTKSS